MPKEFRELDVWRVANDLALEIYGLTKKFPKDEQFGLTNQIRRSASSVPANIAEGCGRYGSKDRIQFFMVARGSIFETRSHLSLAQGLRYMEGEVFNAIDHQYEILTKRLNAFIKKLRED